MTTAIKILHMYADMLDLYGDSGNMEILQYRCRMRGIACEIDHYTCNMELPNFASYDLIYLGGGADLEQQILAKDLSRCKEGLQQAYQAGVFLLMICGGYQLMGQYYRGADGETTPGVGLFDYYTVAPKDRRKRCIGNIILRTQLTGEPMEVIGFENHGGQTHGSQTPFGTVLCGNGNCLEENTEGYCEKNVIATYLHGPLLSKNPQLSDYIIRYCLRRHPDAPDSLAPLNDDLEYACRAVLQKRLLGEKSQ